MKQYRVDENARAYLRQLQNDLRVAYADLVGAQRDFTEIRRQVAPNGTPDEMIKFLARADTRQAVSDKDYACQRMTALGAALSAEVATYRLLHGVAPV